MDTLQIKIFTTTFLTTNHQRKNDKSVIVEISKMNISKQRNIQINACRLYLQVATLSDIANPDGRTINNHFLKRNKPLSHRSIFRWSNQPTLPIPKTLEFMETNGKKSIQHQREWFAPYSSKFNTMDNPVFLKTNATSMEFLNRKRKALWDTQQQRTLSLYSQK